MNLKAWWHEERHYPSGDTFTRGQTIIYGSALVTMGIVLLIIFVTVVPRLFVQAYEGFKADFVSPRPIGEVLQRDADFINMIAPWLVLAGAMFVFVTKVMPHLQLASLKRWMVRNQSGQQ